MSSKQQILTGRFYDNENETGLDRIKNLYKDVWKGVPRAEWNLLYDTFVYSFIGGGVWRAFFGSNTLMKEFHLKHNTAVFMGKTDAKRQIMFFIMERLAYRGIQFGSKCAALATISCFLSLHSFVYRKEFKVSDFSLCTATAFALTRYNRGFKPILSSFVIGLAFGLIGGSAVKLSEYCLNTTLKDSIDEMNKISRRHLFVEIQNPDNPRS